MRFLLLIASLWAFPAWADFHELTAFFEKEVQARKIPGAVILIRQHGRTIYSKSFGARNVMTGAPMSEDTFFALKSMTKPITSVAAMMLIEEGKLHLEDPLSKYIPAFANVQVGVESRREDGTPVLKSVPPVRPVTIEDLLRHTSGITYDYIGAPLIMQAYRDGHIFAGERFNNKIITERIAKLPLARQPGTLWRYGHSTDVLGRVLEIISGEPLAKFLRHKILDPLAMRDTKFTLEPPEMERMAEPLPTDVVLIRSETERRAHPEWESAGGGLVGTITDYAKFAQMILNGGFAGLRRFLRPETFKQMTTDHIGPGSGVGRDYFYFPGDGFGFGYGFAVRVEPGEAHPPAAGSIGELKWDSGSGTYFGVDPKFDMFYILLMQTQSERGRIVPEFKRLVYKAFESRNTF